MGRWQRLYRQKALLRMIFSYAALSAFLLLLCGGWLYSEANKILLDEVSREGQGRLESFERFVEQTFLQKYKELFSGKVIATINSHSNDEIDYFLDRGHAGNTSRVYRLVNDLGMTAQSNKALHSVSISFTQSGFAVDNTFFYARPEHSPDAEYLSRLGEQPMETWLPRTYPDGERVFTYIYTLPYKATGDRIQGYLAINVRLAELEREIAFLLAAPSERLLVLDRGGQPIVNAAGASALDRDILADLIQDSGSGYTIGSVDGETTVTSYSRAADSAEGWTYVIARPMHASFLASRNLQQDIVKVCVFVLSLGLLAAVWLSRRTYRPLGEVIRMIRARYGALLPAQTEESEYKLIDQTFRVMDNNIVRLKDRIRDSALEQLLAGNLARIEDFEGTDGFRYFSVIELQLLRGDAAELRRRLQETLDELRYDICEDGKRRLRVLVMDNRASALEEAPLTARLRRLAETGAPSLVFAAGIGGPRAGLEEIVQAAELAARAMRHTFVLGPSAIVAASELDARTEPVKGIAYEHLRHAIKSGDPERTDHFFRQAEASLSAPELQLEAVELALLRLYSVLSETIIESGLHKALLPEAGSFEAIKQLTLAATLEKLRQLAGQASEPFNQDPGSVHAELIGKLKNYIDTHAHEDISLYVLGELAGLTPAYVSTLFKETLGVSFSEYLTGARMERAKQLLASSGLTVTEIAARVGYRNLQYFCTRFKAYSGMTPNQYKSSGAGARQQA
ncbi:AraC family transcriptional regulator [Paenibacillus sp. IB182496]|uniref:AraC family transcriptional regulator n=1 Tax=Paenibacillus sabuli TaxID=2772509 RepID=A0A927BNB8_9BACL|nr:AraC family transcriptional regulator [Paenibacillus sabuli]MBD2843703.1 AraC family transcriptional regulator [Paenibacillus sabuli]